MDIENRTTSFNIVGMKIVGQHGREFGTVTEVDGNLETLRVDQIEVKLDRESLDDLEFKTPFVGTQTVKFPPQEVSGISDILVLNSPIADIQVLGGKPAKH